MVLNDEVAKKFRDIVNVDLDVDISMDSEIMPKQKDFEFKMPDFESELRRTNKKTRNRR